MSTRAPTGPSPGAGPPLSPSSPAPPNNWDLETIEHDIFLRYDPEALQSTPVDPGSIMMYPIPASWTTDGFFTDLNRKLSDTDRQFIRDAYPW